MNDHKRGQRLADKRQRRAALSAMPPPPTLSVAKKRLLVAEAVHRVVAEHTRSDGLGHCMLYAIVGSMAVSRALGKVYLPQAGSLYLAPNPADPDSRFVFDARQGGLSQGEFHCWLATAGAYTRPRPGQAPPAVEVVDLTARHYRRMVESYPLAVREWERPSWGREDAPAVLWADNLRPGQTDVEGWVQLVPDAAACGVVVDNQMANGRAYSPLWDRATLIYEALLARAE